MLHLRVLASPPVHFGVHRSTVPPVRRLHQPRARFSSWCASAPLLQTSICDLLLRNFPLLATTNTPLACQHSAPALSLATSTAFSPPTDATRHHAPTLHRVSPAALLSHSAQVPWKSGTISAPLTTQDHLRCGRTRLDPHGVIADDMCKEIPDGPLVHFKKGLFAIRCTLLPFEINLPPDSPPVTSRPQRPHQSDPLQRSQQHHLGSPVPHRAGFI